MVYQNYLGRSKFTEGLSLTADFKTAVNEYYLRNAVFPVCNAQLGFADATQFSGEYVQRVEVLPNTSCTVTNPAPANAGWIQVTFKPGVYENTNNKIILTPTLNIRQLRWNCSTNTTIEERFRPFSCK